MLFILLPPLGHRLVNVIHLWLLQALAFGSQLGRVLVNVVRVDRRIVFVTHTLRCCVLLEEWTLPAALP